MRQAIEFLPSPWSIDSTDLVFYKNVNKYFNKIHANFLNTLYWIIVRVKIGVREVTLWERVNIELWWDSSTLKKNLQKWSKKRCQLCAMRNIHHMILSNYERENSNMIRNILKWREESDTYLPRVCRHHWSRNSPMKIEEITGAFSQHCGFHQL